MQISNLFVTKHHSCIISHLTFWRSFNNSSPNWTDTYVRAHWYDTLIINSSSRKLSILFVFNLGSAGFISFFSWSDNTHLDPVKLTPLTTWGRQLEARALILFLFQFNFFKNKNNNRSDGNRTVSLHHWWQLSAPKRARLRPHVAHARHGHTPRLYTHTHTHTSHLNMHTHIRNEWASASLA